MKNRLFILAHPDDEIFCLPFLLEKDYRNFFVYLTSGKMPSQSIKIIKIRQCEIEKSFKLMRSEAVMEQILLKNTTQDSVLYREISGDLIQELLDCILRNDISECCTMKFEGGHQDHDITNVLTRLFCQKLQIGFREFAMYSASEKKILNFKINMDSVQGEILKFNRIKVALLAMRMMKIYGSQWRTWIGLSLPLIQSYIFSTWRDGFANPNEPIKNPRYALYEIRGKATVAQIKESIESLHFMFEDI